jgi:hypothetical protein
MSDWFLKKNRKACYQYKLCESLQELGDRLKSILCKEIGEVTEHLCSGIIDPAIFMTKTRIFSEQNRDSRIIVIS